MRWVRVVVGPAGDRQAVRIGRLEISRRFVCVVFAVIRLERIEAGAGERGDQIVASEQSRMCERGDAARRVDSIEDVRRSGADAWNECRLARRKKPVERLSGVSDMPARDQRPSHPWPAGRFRCVVAARLQHGVGVENDSEA